MKHFKIFTLLISVFLVSCHLTNKDVKNKSWKYAEGFHLGDWVEFSNSGFVLSHDSIFENGKAVARIIDSESNLLENKNSITIESIPTKEKGAYLNK